MRRSAHASEESWCGLDNVARDNPDLFIIYALILAVAAFPRGVAGNESYFSKNLFVVRQSNVVLIAIGFASLGIWVAIRLTVQSRAGR